MDLICVANENNIWKTKVYDLKIDVAKTNLCIGDDLEIDVDAKGVLELFYFKEIEFINRFLGRKKPKRLKALSSEDSENLSQKLKKAHKIRVRVVGISPKHLSNNKYNEVHVSVWIG